MDIQDMISMLLGSAQKEPDILSQLVEHPYSTIRGVTGLQDITREQASQVVAGTAAAARGQQIDLGNLAGIAQMLLGSSDNSVHSMADMLLGSGHSAGVNMSQGVGDDILSNILSLGGSLFGGSQQPSAQSNYDAGYQAGYEAAMKRGGGAQQGGGLDFGDIASLLFGGR
ncbi:MAG: hypothetical protein IKE61_02830 [Coriobacteriales bacterium]|nr:hypothetical protein [Coriobacteriales bacterium]